MIGGVFFGIVAAAPVPLDQYPDTEPAGDDEGEEVTMPAPYGIPDAAEIDARILKLKDAYRIANEVRIAVKTKLSMGAGNRLDSPSGVTENVDRMRKFTAPQVMLPGA